MNVEKEGKKILLIILNCFQSEYKVIHNVNLNHRIESHEFYATLIGTAGIIHIENKNEGGENGLR